MNWSWRRTVIVLLVLVLLTMLAFLAISTPTKTGSEFHQVGIVNQAAEARPMRLKEWRRCCKIRDLDRRFHVERVRSLSRASSGPCYRVEGKVDGDSLTIDNIVEGFGHFKLCVRAGDHTTVIDRYSGANQTHRETWAWDLKWVEVTRGAGVSTTWCNGGVGPCKAVEYRYWRFTWQWMQGIDVFGQDVAHHKTVYMGCTLRAGGAGWHCGAGDVS